MDMHMQKYMYTLPVLVNFYFGFVVGIMQRIIKTSKPRLTKLGNEGTESLTFMPN